MKNSYTITYSKEETYSVDISANSEEEAREMFENDDFDDDAPRLKSTEVMLVDISQNE